jgi:diguanylate cyclase (GGDEF)-like protein/PAS domain S-box-containing protein
LGDIKLAIETTLRLIVIENSANDANAYVKALRASGVAVREHFIVDKNTVEEKISDHQPDLILISPANSYVAVAELPPLLEKIGSHASIVVMCAEKTEMSVAKAIEAGARDRVMKADIEHLQAVARRELAYVTLANRHASLDKLYRESEARCQILMENSRDAIAYVHQGMHVYANKAYLEMFGFNSFDDIEGLPIMDMVAPEKQEEFKQFLRATQKDKKAAFETQLIDVKHEPFVGRMEFSEASIEGEPCTQILIRQNVGDTSALEAQINQLSRLDPLTSLLNRQAFLEEFGKALTNVSKKNKRYSLFQVGIDDFKTIQNTVGLVGSDQVIAEIAGLIKGSLEATDLAGRYEGSKYLVLSEASVDKVILARAGVLIKAIDKHICQVGDKSISIRSHIGISLIDDDSLDVNEVMARAEKALTEASSPENKTRIHLYQPKEGEMTQKQIDAAWIKRLKEAMDNERFHLLFQPIIQLDSSETERYEVFMEMVDEKGGRVPTGDFMPAAERTKMSKILDRWVITKATQHLVTRLKTNPNTAFFIKLTGGSLEDMELFRWISEKLKAANIPKWRVIFEVKEDAVVSHLKQAQAFATLLKTIQCGFAIDDFGKGPDPFKLVELVPAQYLKFDKNFTTDLSKNQQNQNTLREITEKAKELKKHTIIQHVEDAATLSVLWTIGANFTQGNFFQGPTKQMDYDFSAGGL